jgi:hypothetical protein
MNFEGRYYCRNGKMVSVLPVGGVDGIKWMGIEYDSMVEVYYDGNGLAQLGRGMEWDLMERENPQHG